MDTEGSLLPCLAVHLGMLKPYGEMNVSHAARDEQFKQVNMTRSAIEEVENDIFVCFALLLVCCCVLYLDIVIDRLACVLCL